MSNSERIIRIVHILSIITERNGMSLSNLAQECQVSVRAIYRD